MSLYDPIRSVTPIDYNGVVVGVTVSGIPQPTEYPWKLSDLSGPNAGRTMAYVMNKQRKGQAVTVTLKWEMLTFAEAAIVLQAFNPEYVRLELLDAKSGTWVTRDFYVGDRESTLKST
jgi:hypothetical protein